MILALQSIYINNTKQTVDEFCSHIFMQILGKKEILDWTDISQCMAISSTQEFHQSILAMQFKWQII